MNYEHHIVAPVGYKVLELQVSQRYYIGDGVFTKPRTILVAISRFLMVHFHRAAIDIQSHFRF